MASISKPSFSILQPKNGQDKILINGVVGWITKCLESLDDDIVKSVPVHVPVPAISESGLSSSSSSSSLTSSSSSSSSFLKPSKYTVMVTQVQCFDPNCVPLGLFAHFYTLIYHISYNIYFFNQNFQFFFLCLHIHVTTDMYFYIFI